VKLLYIEQKYFDRELRELILITRINN